MRKKIFAPPSLKLNTVIVVGVVLLLVVSMAIIFHQSRQTLKQEAVQNAELMLEATTLRVENILRSVEQTTGNIYYDMIMHFSEHDRFETYTREMVESNPYIYGCAIALSPQSTADKNRFLVYTHRRKFDSSDLVTSNRYSDKPYMEQAWYVDPSKSGQIFWMVPKKDRRDDDVPLMLYCIPIRFGNGIVAAVIVVEVSMDLFSQVVQKAKPSSHSYSMLLDSDGSYLIHPDHNKLNGQTIYTSIEEDADTAMLSTANAILSGKSGYKSFREQGKEYYAFYKPFFRTNEQGHKLYNINWSICLIYPKEDITAPLNELFLSVLSISAIGLLLFFLFTRIVIRQQTKPLRRLTQVAEEIADGSYDEEIPKTRRMDEIGEFQRHFKHMQDALLARVDEQEKLTSELRERQKSLRKALEQIQENEHVNTDILNKVSKQMMTHSQAISASVDALCDNPQNISQEEAQHEVETIRRQREAILGQLNQMFNTSENEVGKEDSHE